MKDKARFKGRGIAELSEAEARAALAELLDPQKAETVRRIPPRVRRAGLSPAPDPSAMSGESEEPA